jgi:hypothetical protein
MKQPVSVQKDAAVIAANISLRMTMTKTSLNRPILASETGVVPGSWVYDRELTGPQLTNVLIDCRTALPADVVQAGAGKITEALTFYGVATRYRVEC